MIEWLSNTFDLRFYYWTGLNWIILFPTYVIGAGLIGLLWWRLAKRVKRAWIVILPLFALLAIGPWVEELWIARNFGQLCRKDAGIFIYKTVEVEGFYDDTTHWWRQLQESKYQFVESKEYGSNKLWRVERSDEELRHFEIDQPTARYHYRRVSSHLPTGHGVQKFENVVVDAQTNDILGRYVNYYRSAPWFFVALDRPTMPCLEAERDTRKYGTLMVYSLVLRASFGGDQAQE